MIFWLSIILAVLSYIVGAGALLTDAGMDPTTVKQLIAILSLVVGAGNTVVAAVSNKPPVITNFAARFTRR